jgi:hypothetical protein
MQVAKSVQQTISLQLDRADDLGMTMSNEGDTEPRSEIDVAVPVGIDHVCALGFYPNDRIVVGPGLLLTPLSARGQRRALALGKPLYPSPARRGWNRRSDGWH